MKKFVVRLSLAMVMVIALTAGCVHMDDLPELHETQMLQEMQDSQTMQTAQETQITQSPPPVTEQAERTTAGSTSAPGPERQGWTPSFGFITIGEMSYPTTLTMLSLSDMGLSDEDIEPLQNMTALTILYMSGNQISDISPLSGLKNLEWIDLSNNQIVDISPLSGLENLEGVLLDGNQISDISPLLGLEKLQDARIQGNPINDMSPESGIITIRDVMYITSLVRLDLSDMGLTDEDIIPLRYMTRLRELHLGIGPGCSCDPDADYVNGWHNQISDISPLSQLTELTYLDLSFNQISDISPLSGLINLETLALHGNQIYDISPLAELINLRDLWLQNNQISDISVLSEFTKLKWLFLERNQISDVTPLAGLTNLTWLTLDDNQISDISPLSKLTASTSLSIYGNIISDWSPIAHIVNIKAESIGITSANIRLYFADSAYNRMWLRPNELFNLRQIESYHEFVKSEDGARIVFTTKAAVRDFKFLEIHFNNNYSRENADENERLYITGQVLYSRYEFTPESPIVISGVNLGGAVAVNGFSFRDQDGEIRYFAILGGGADNDPPVKTVEF